MEDSPSNAACGILGITKVTERTCLKATNDRLVIDMGGVVKRQGERKASHWKKAREVIQWRRAKQSLY